MSLSINTNSAAQVALETLNQTTSDLNATENTVSTGQKVSNAADNPAIYAIAASMNGNIQGLSAVSDSLSMGAQVVSTATKAISHITSTLQTLQQSVTTAGQTGLDASAMASQVLSALDTINTYARNSTFNGVNLLTSGSDATNAYNGTTLNTLTNLQGSTQTFGTASGNSTTLLDSLGLTTLSAAGSSAADSQQSIYSALNGSNVTDINTSALKASDINLGNGTTSGTTVTADGKTFEFVSAGDDVSTKGNIAVSLSSGFSVTQAMSSLVSAMNGAGVAASVNADGSLAVQGSAYTTGETTQGTAIAVTAGTSATVAAGGKTYQIVNKASDVTAGNIGVVVASGATSADMLSALATASKGTISYDSSSDTLSSGSALTFGAGITKAASSTANVTMSNPISYTTDVSSLTTDDIKTATDTSGSGTQITVSGKTYEFTTDASKVGPGNTAIVLSTGFTVSDALNALSSASGGTIQYDSTKKQLTSTAEITSTNVATPTDLPTSVSNGGVVTTFVTSAGTAADQLAVGFKSGVSGAITALQSAITTLSSKAQTLGNYSNQITGLQSYTSDLSDAMTSGVGALTDADMAAESAKLTSLQTKQQLAISTLSIAKSSSQNILSLFR